MASNFKQSISQAAVLCATPCRMALGACLFMHGMNRRERRSHGLALAPNAPCRAFAVQCDAAVTPPAARLPAVPRLPACLPAHLRTTTLQQQGACHKSHPRHVPMHKPTPTLSTKEHALTCTTRQIPPPEKIRRPRPHCPLNPTPHPHPHTTPPHGQRWLRVPCPGCFPANKCLGILVLMARSDSPTWSRGGWGGGGMSHEPIGQAAAGAVTHDPEKQWLSTAATGMTGQGRWKGTGQVGYR